MDKRDLKPASVFAQFAEINKIPRPSKHEKRMIEYLTNWGKAHNLETKVDETGNVLIKKGATPGMEGRKTVVLQSHMDMVCDKLVDVAFDFYNDPIRTHIEGEWLTAEGTTLGADDGIGVAIELAILEAENIEHGPIECVFTVDEETQLTGANGMKAGFMSGDMLINLDSEDEGQVFVSCAGGRTTTATFTFERENLPVGDGYFFLKGSLKGLKGGHSGDDIEKKRANAIKILGRFLYKEMCKYDLRLIEFNSGKMHNAIPRDGVFVIAVPKEVKENVKADWNVFACEVADEFHVTDKDMVFAMESANPAMENTNPTMESANPAMESTASAKVIAQDVAQNFIRSIQAVDNGVYAMCQDEDISWLVETSSNVASVVTGEDTITVVASQRSNVMSNLENECNTVKATFELAGAKVHQNDGYPAWKMNPNSQLTKIVVDTYKKLFGKNPVVKGIHAGLECGLFSERYPNMDMVSFGPTLRNVHTPDEKLHIPTVEMVWNHLLEVLKNIPMK